MTTISPNMLNDTLNLVALARETALSRGEEVKAQRLTPVVENLRSVAVEAQKTRPDTAASDLLAQSDFQTLLAAVQKQPEGSSTSQTPVERNQVVKAMAAGGMSHVDIARQMGMAREEVRTILSLAQTGGVNAAAQAVPQYTAAGSNDREAGQTVKATMTRRINDAYGGWQKQNVEAPK